MNIPQLTTLTAADGAWLVRLGKRSRIVNRRCRKTERRRYFVAAFNKWPKNRRAHWGENAGGRRKGDK